MCWKLLAGRQRRKKRGHRRKKRSHAFTAASRFSYGDQEAACGRQAAGVLQRKRKQRACPSFGQNLKEINGKKKKISYDFSE